MNLSNHFDNSKINDFWKWPKYLLNWFVGKQLWDLFIAKYLTYLYIFRYGAAQWCSGWHSQNSEKALAGISTFFDNHLIVNMQNNFHNQKLKKKLFFFARVDTCCRWSCFYFLDSCSHKFKNKHATFNKTIFLLLQKISYKSIFWQTKPKRAKILTFLWKWQSVYPSFLPTLSYPEYSVTTNKSELVLIRSEYLYVLEFLAVALKHFTT